LRLESKDGENPMFHVDVQHREKRTWEKTEELRFSMHTLGFKAKFD
jgi:hypothetical protein